jgi:hypothetical protein
VFIGFGITDFNLLPLTVSDGRNRKINPYLFSFPKALSMISCQNISSEGAEIFSQMEKSY